MKFQSTLLIWIVLLIAAITVATAGSALVVLERSARENASDELVRSARVFDALRDKRKSLRLASAHVVSEEPRLKAVVSTEDVSPETVYGVAFELRKAVQSDLFLMTDGAGRLLADVADPKASGFDMSQNPVIHGALETGESTGIWTAEGRVYEVVARRIAFGTNPVGVLVLGFALNDAIVEEAASQTGSVVAVLLDNKVVAVSHLENGEDAPREALATLGKGLSDETRGLATPGKLEESRVVSTTTALTGADEKGPKLRVLHLRSLERALAPSREVETRVALIAAVALVAAALLAMVLARRLSSPVDKLVAFTKALGHGKLDARASVEGPIELRALGEAMNRMAVEIDESRLQMAAKERLEKEMEISARIQTSILPRRLDVPGLDVAAQMIPASEVGGDYYDVFAVKNGGWIAIGDVAGHGLTSGLVMLMVQSAIAALGRDKPNASPKDLVRVLNAVLYDNIRNRLGNDEHVTLSLMRYERSGRVVFAGAHEDIILFRAGTGTIETIETLGPWLGAMRDVSRTVMDDELLLDDGDLLVLYTDGITEARNESGEQFSFERLCARVKALGREPVEAIRDAILNEVKAFSKVQEDDLTLLLVRYKSPNQEAGEEAANHHDSKAL